MSTAQESWTTDELALLDGARAKLTKLRNNGALFLVGFIVLMAATGVNFMGGIGFSALAVVSAVIRLQRIDKLEPGTPLNVKTLGVRTPSEVEADGGNFNLQRVLKVSFAGFAIVGAVALIVTQV